MTTVKLNDEIFKELHILKKSEWDRIGSDYKTTASFDERIKAGFFCICKSIIYRYAKVSRFFQNIRADFSAPLMLLFYFDLMPQILCLRFQIFHHRMLQLNHRITLLVLYSL